MPKEKEKEKKQPREKPEERRKTLGELKREECKSHEQEIKVALKATIDLARAYDYQDIAQCLEKVLSGIGNGNAVDELLSKL